MANPEHINILKQGVETWNQWRQENPGIRPDLAGMILLEPDLRKADLSRADLSGAHLMEANLSEANLNEADLTKVNLHKANISLAHLRGAKLNDADLILATFVGADLTGAHLVGAHLMDANLSAAILVDAKLMKAELGSASLAVADLTRADLQGADLSLANLVHANLEGANIENCLIFGVSVWDLKGKPLKQSNLLISKSPNQAAIKVDNLEVAQFIYLLLNNEKIRDVINTIGQKAVLILGRFSAERKEILETIADALREKGYLPIIFDFEKSQERDFTETIKTLAGLSLFVIVDITNPKSSPLELQATVPDYRIPFVPIIQKGEEPFSMFKDLTIYDWVLKPVRAYETKERLLLALDDKVIKPALAKHVELVKRKAEELETETM